MLTARTPDAIENLHVRCSISGGALRSRLAKMELEAFNLTSEFPGDNDSLKERRWLRFPVGKVTGGSSLRRSKVTALISDPNNRTHFE